jgi:hypothetical protein
MFATRFEENFISLRRKKLEYKSIEKSLFVFLKKKLNL